MHDIPNGSPQAQPQEVAQIQDSYKNTGRGDEGDCRPCDPCPWTLPSCLAGYQNVVVGETKTGDILVRLGTIEGFAPIGMDVEGFGNNIAIYRKMPCAKHLDHEYPEPPPEKIEQAKAKTYDDGKPPLAYLPWAGIDEVAMVQAYGHKKYKDFNNYRKGMEVGRNLSCAIRHIRAFMEGEDLDKESERSHLAHAACRLLFVLQNIHDGKAIDDRFKKPENNP